MGRCQVGEFRIYDNQCRDTYASQRGVPLPYLRHNLQVCFPQPSTLAPTGQLVATNQEIGSMNLHFLLNHHSSKLRGESCNDLVLSYNRSCSALSPLGLTPALKRTRFEDDTQSQLGCKSPTTITRSYSVQHLLLPPVEIPSPVLITNSEDVGMKTVGFDREAKLEQGRELILNSQSTVVRNPSFDVGSSYPQDPAYRLAQVSFLSLHL